MKKSSLSFTLIIALISVFVASWMRDYLSENFSGMPSFWVTFATVSASAIAVWVVRKKHRQIQI